MSTNEGLNRAYRGPAADDVLIAQQGKGQNLSGGIQTRGQTGDLPQATTEKIAESAKFLAEGDKDADVEIGAGKGAKQRDLREGRS